MAFRRELRSTCKRKLARRAASMLWPLSSVASARTGAFVAANVPDNRKIFCRRLAARLTAPWRWRHFLFCSMARSQRPVHGVLKALNAPCLRQCSFPAVDADCQIVGAKIVDGDELHSRLQREPGMNVDDAQNGPFGADRYAAIYAAQTNGFSYGLGNHSFARFDLDHFLNDIPAAAIEITNNRQLLRDLVLSVRLG